VEEESDGNSSPAEKQITLVLFEEGEIQPNCIEDGCSSKAVFGPNQEEFWYCLEHNDSNEAFMPFKFCYTGMLFVLHFHSNVVFHVSMLFQKIIQEGHVVRRRNQGWSYCQRLASLGVSCPSVSLDKYHFQRFRNE